MFNIFKILFFMFIAYMIYNLLKTVLFLGRSVNSRRHSQGHMNSGQASEGSRSNGKKPGKDDQVIELDKDQYKVE